MELHRLILIFLLFFPLYTSCQDGTATTSSSQQSKTTPMQPTAAVVQENTTRSSASSAPDTNSTSSPGTQGQGNNTTPSTDGPTPTPSSANATNVTESISEANATKASTTESTDQDLPTEDPTNEEPTGTLISEDDEPTSTQASAPSEPSYYELCPSGVPCERLGADCLNCSMDTSCVYGREYNATCLPKQGLDCIGSLPIQKTYQCRYCYQTEVWQQSCTPANTCQVYACPKQYIRVNCTVDEEVFCLGSRNFHRRKPCNWTSGYKWTTALILSITLGGFGADRFYLGYWQSGLGKLFSFGGAGVWTLIDVLLIAVGYITPSDGSHYIY